MSEVSMYVPRVHVLLSLWYPSPATWPTLAPKTVMQGYLARQNLQPPWP